MKQTSDPLANETQVENKKCKADEPVDSESLANASSLKKSKKSDADDDGNDMEIYRIAGKKAAALLDPFAVPINAFMCGIDHDRGKDVDEKYGAEAVKRHLHFYQGFLKLVPSLRAELDTILPQRLNKIIKAITKGMSDGRSQDLSAVKKKGLKYVPYNMSEVLFDIAKIEDKKSGRGIFHQQLARLMCPHRYVQEFDLDPTAGMEALQGGDFPMKASRWPTLFYDEDTLFYDKDDIQVYEPKSNQAGLLRHHAVVRVYQHLFDGPASVNGDTTRKAKQAKNGAWSLQSVDRHIIAYVHIITYITLSHAEQWTEKIGQMDLQETYWRIIELLDDESDLWVRETLKWWNNQGKTLPRSSIMTSKQANDDSEDDMAGIRAQRAKKQAKTTARKTSAFNERVTESGAESDNPFSNSFEERRVIQRRPQVKTVQAEFRREGSRPQPRPIRTSTAAIQGKTTTRAWDLQDEPEDQDSLVDPSHGELDNQGELEDQDVADSLTGIDSAAYDAEDDIPLAKEQRFAQDAPAKGGPVQRHSLEANSHPRAKPMPMKTSVTPRQATIRGTAAQKQRKEKPDAHVADDVGGGAVALTAQAHDSDEGPNIQVVVDNALTQKAQNLAQHRDRRAPAKLLRITERQVSESHPQLKATMAVRCTAGKKTQATRRDQHSDSDAHATLAADKVGNGSTSTTVELECYATDSQSDVAHSPLSELTDDDAQASRGDKMTSQLRILIPAKRVQSSSIANVSEKIDVSTAPAPQKRAKKVSTAPTKRNPARKNRANGF